jgi:hypothetical protein
MIIKGKNNPLGSPKGADKKRKTALVLAVILVMIVSLVAVIHFATYPHIESQSVKTSFDYQLNIYPLNSTVTQGNSVTANINVTYLQGTPQNVTLNAYGVQTNVTYSFSNQTGKPLVRNPFTSNLTIKVLTTASSNTYMVNISATSPNGKTYSSPYNLTILNAEIQVSGSVDLTSRTAVVPSALQFIDTASNRNYTAGINFNIPSPYRGLIQQGTYNISLPNQHSYKVICYWVGFFGIGVIPLPNASGTIDFGTLVINGGVGVCSMTKNYSG